ncbi:unnamed protein product [Ectocarpus sp. 13 AM-2016]
MSKEGRRSEHSCGRKRFGVITSHGCPFPPSSPLCLLRRCCCPGDENTLRWGATLYTVRFDRQNVYVWLYFVRSSPSVGRESRSKCVRVAVVLGEAEAGEATQRWQHVCKRKRGCTLERGRKSAHTTKAKNKLAARHGVDCGLGGRRSSRKAFCCVDRRRKMLGTWREALHLKRRGLYTILGGKCGGLLHIARPLLEKSGGGGVPPLPHPTRLSCMWSEL